MWLLQQMLKGLYKKGTLIVIDPEGRAHAYGDGTAPRITIRVHDRGLTKALLRDSSLAIGEAFMDGALTIEDGDIYDFLDLGMRNMRWSNGDHWAMKLHGVLRRLGRRIAQHNPVGRARKNVAHHYDLNGALYDLFLDRDRQYSCAYFMGPDDSIELAQAQKKRHLAAKLLLQPGHKVLDIGSGWGGLGLYLAGETGADVTGVTLSEEQHKVSSARAVEQGLAERVRFKLQDYRNETGTFDRIVSVGMFEHVGVGHYREFFKKMYELLADDGVAVLHSIGRADGPGATNGWITKYIFPGGYSPALSEVIPIVERVGFHITDVEILRLHYADTLLQWRRRFNANRGTIAKLYDERFCRMFEFYLAGSEATFRHGGHMNFQIQLAKKVDTVPLTRDYMFAFEQGHKLADMPAGPRNVSARE